MILEDDAGLLLGRGARLNSSAFSAPFLISTLHDITPKDFQAGKRSHKKTQTPNSRKCRITNVLTQSVLILTVRLHCIPYAYPVHSRYLYEIGFLTVAGGLSMA